MQLHDPFDGTTPSQRMAAFERSRRQARIAERAVTYKPPVQRIEIKETPSETAVEITACNGQIVLISERAIAEAKIKFERVAPGDGSQVSIEKIQRAVCKRFEISRVDLISNRRTLKHVTPRHVAMYLAKTLTLKSLPEIGRRFGGKDHTTVLHAVRKIEFSTSEEIRQHVAELSAELCGGER